MSQHRAVERDRTVPSTPVRADATAITVADVQVDGSDVVCTVDVPGRLQRFFRDDTFSVSYDVDVSTVPEHVLTIPVVGHVCPVAWATGTDVTVGAIDREFADSLPAVRAALHEMYPEFVTTEGEVRPTEVVDERPDSPFGETAQLFSGGVDSLTTYVRHREENPTLISIHGWVIDDDNAQRWDETQSYFEEFAAQRGLTHRTVRSNMLSFLNVPMLDAHYRQYHGGSWYSHVGHGLGLLSLCAPLAYATGIGMLRIASSHTEKYEGIPWGSHPTIDDEINWSGTRVAHDGYDLCRQAKVERIAEYVHETGDDDFTIRTCLYDENGGNCNACEKCYRTMLGLRLAGLDPNEFGYDYSHDVLSDVVDGFENNEWILIEDKPFYWREIRSRVPDDDSDEPPEVRAFYEWLRDADFDEFTEAATSPLKHRAVRLAARHTPYRLYAPLYRLYDGVMDRLSGGSA
jgi:hypothetical protein